MGPADTVVCFSVNYLCTDLSTVHITGWLCMFLNKTNSVRVLQMQRVLIVETTSDSLIWLNISLYRNMLCCRLNNVYIMNGLQNYPW